MKTASRIALLALLGAIGFWLWTIWFPNPQKLVLKKVAQLAATATVKPADSPITRLTKVSDLIGYFSTDAVISYDAPEVGARTVTGRDEIRELAAGGLGNVTSLQVQFLDATARVAPDKQSAEVTCTARVSTGDGKDFGLQELRIQFRKIDGDWLITRAETTMKLQ
jgi:hypothetical protein